MICLDYIVRLSIAAKLQFTCKWLSIEGVQLQVEWYDLLDIKIW